MNTEDIRLVEKNIVTPDNATILFGYSNSHPIITFTIPNSDKFLIGSSVRLNGRLEIVGNDGLTRVNNAQNVSGEPLSNSCLPNNVGVSSLISSITLNSTNNTTLERIQNYGRFVASSVSATHSAQDYDSSLGILNLMSSRSKCGALLNNRKTSFSTPLYTGLLMGTPLISMSNTATRGLVVQIELTSDASAMSPFLKNDGTRDTEIGFQENSTYRLSDINLSFDMVVPIDPMMASPKNGMLEYNSITNLYSVIRSSDETINLNLSNSQTISIYHNFIPANRINNHNYNSYETMKLMDGGANANSSVEIDNVSFTKSGLRFPVDYEQVTSSIPDRPLSNVLFNFNDAIRSMNKYNHCMFSVNSTSPIDSDVREVRNMTLNPTLELASKNTLTDVRCWGVGCSQDFLQRIGVNYKNSPYALRIQSTLQDSTPNSVYTYTMSKNIISYNSNGIQVVS